MKRSYFDAKKKDTKPPVLDTKSGGNSLGQDDNPNKDNKTSKHDSRANTKVDGSYVTCFLNWIPRFDWYVVQLGSKSKPHKDTCLKKIGLHL